MAGQRLTPGTLIFVLLVTAFLTAFLVYPVFYVFEQAFLLPPTARDLLTGPDPFRAPQSRLSLQYFRLMLGSETERECLWNSTALALVTVAGTSLMVFPLVVLTARYRFAGRRLLTGLLMVPMIMPPFVGAIGMKRLLAREGSINLLLMQWVPATQRGLVWLRAAFGHAPAALAEAVPSETFDGIDFMGSGGFWAIALMQVLHLYPIMYLNAVAALANVDPSLEDAARNLGSHGLGLFRRVTLPLMMPGYFAGAILVFVWAFTDLGTPLIFGFRRVVAVRIFDRLEDITENPMGYANVVAMVVVSAGAFMIGRRLAGRRSYAMASKGTVGAREKPLRPLAAVLAAAAIMAVVGVALLPHVGVVLTAIQSRWTGTVLPSAYTGRWFGAVFTHNISAPSIRNSLFLSLSSSLMDVILGVGLAVILVRKRFRGSGILDALAMMPLALPGLVLAFGYVACYTGVPGLSPRENPIPLLIIAYAVRRLPFMLRSVVAGLQQTSESLEEASLNLGATPGQTLGRITVPLIMANIIAGAILTFSFAMLEVSDSLILAFSPRYFPITKAIYSLNNRIADGPFIASAMGILAMALLTVTLLTAGALMGKKMGEIFRAG